ncbi:MAG: type II secretion system F family protein [Fusobacterium sp.]|nr:type II secretion system F family protein [Fusobacterium sp.]
MPIFNYTALKNNKDVISGKVEAYDISSARAEIKKLGYTPISIVDEKQNENNVKNKAKAALAPLPTLGLQDKIEFTSTMQILVQAGIPIIESLMFIENDAAKAKLRKVAKELRKQIIGGGTFSGTIARYPLQFGHIYIGLCKAGEDTGELEKTLDRLLELLSKQAAIRGQIIGTLMYPFFVVILSVLIILIMLLFVFPVFKDMFDNMGKELPLITAVLMQAGLFLKANWICIPVGFIAFGAGVTAIMRYAPTRKIVHRIGLKIPVMGTMLRFGDFSNFVAVMQVAYDAGIPIVECLHLAILTITNDVLREQLDASIINVSKGQHLSVALRATGAVPKMILFMIATGEQSGRLGDMLGQCTIYIDKKLNDIISTLTKMIEPIMLLVIGGIVCVLALALYLPLFASYMD